MCVTEDAFVYMFTGTAPTTRDVEFSWIAHNVISVADSHEFTFSVAVE